MNNQTVIKLGKRYSKQYGLKDWKFEVIDIRTLPSKCKTWDLKSKYIDSILGACYHPKKTIYISKTHCQNHLSDYIKNTIKHEIAHALVSKKVKPHGKEWRSKCREMGVNFSLYYYLESRIFNIYNIHLWFISLLFIILFSTIYKLNT